MSVCHRSLIPFLLFSGAALFGQLPTLPEAAQVTLYFPHLADGGPAAQQWQTKLTFLNPNDSSVNVTLYFYADNGGPLNLDFGSGASSQISFSIPAFGSRVFRSKIASPTITTGWARGGASLPVQSTLTFRAIRNGTPSVEISASPTQPTTQYASAATPELGIAVANRSSAPVSILLSVFDSEGQSLGGRPFALPALGHLSFNLSQWFPNLPAGFAGTAVLFGQGPGAGDSFVAWTLASEAGTLSSLPDGRFPSSATQYDRIWLAYTRVLSAARKLFDMGTQPITLDISIEPEANAKGGAAGIKIYLALAELISDSPSELAFVIGHELGHVYQGRSGRNFLYASNVEYDADAFGTLVALVAGYDPYAAAGALAKLAMATGTASLATQFEEQNAADAHKSFNTRIGLVFDMLQAVCSSSAQARAACSIYRSVVHPHLPPTAPLARDNHE